MGLWSTFNNLGYHGNHQLGKDPLKLCLFSKHLNAPKLKLKTIFLKWQETSILCLLVTQILGLNIKFWRSNEFLKVYSKKIKKYFKNINTVFPTDSYGVKTL